MTKPAADLLTTREAAQYLGVHLMTMYTWVRHKKVPACKIGGQWMLSRAMLDEWLAEKMRKHTQKTAR